MDKELKQWQDTNCVSDDGAALCYWADPRAKATGRPCCTKCELPVMDGMGNCLSLEIR